MGLSATIIGVYVGLRGEIGFRLLAILSLMLTIRPKFTGGLFLHGRYQNYQTSFVIFSQVEGTIYVSTTFSHLLSFAKVSANISFPLGLRLKICNYQILEMGPAFYYSVEPFGIVI